MEHQNLSVKNPVFRRILFGILTIAVLLALSTIGVWAEVSGGTVPDGVYALKNKATGKFLDIQYDSPNAGMHIQQYAYDITPSTPDTRSGLFKFTHRGGNNYLIRSMRNNANSFYRQSDTAVLTTPIETVDIDNPMKAHWILSDAGNGYVYIRAYQTDKYLCAPTSGVNNGKYCTTETLASGGDRAKWKMVRYTGSAMYGVELSSWTDTMVSGETTRIAAYMYTTDMAYHGPVRYSVTAWDGSSTSLATINADGNVTVNGAGQFRIWMTYAGAPTSWYKNVTARLADGVYFLQNHQTERYMQVDDDDAPNYTNNGGIMEIHPLDGESYQRWNLSYLGDGYYRITSSVSGYAVTVPTGHETDDNVNLILKPYTGSDNQKWRIASTKNGSFKIKAKSSESYTQNDLVMSLETALYTNGTNIRQRKYLDNSSYKDEWYLLSPENSVCGIFTGYKTPTRTFTIQCTGTLATGTTWFPLIQESSNAWNSTSAGTNISITTAPSSYVCEVGVYADTWFGVTSFPSNSSTINSATILINARTCDTDNNSRKSTITHEIGHLLGLADNPPISANKSLMNYDRNKKTVYTPQAYDIMNVKYIYS